MRALALLGLFAAAVPAFAQPEGSPNVFTATRNAALIVAGEITAIHRTPSGHPTGEGASAQLHVERVIKGPQDFDSQTINFDLPEVSYMYDLGPPRFGLFFLNLDPTGRPQTRKSGATAYYVPVLPNLPAVASTADSTPEMRVAIELAAAFTLPITAIPSTAMPPGDDSNKARYLDSYAKSFFGGVSIDLGTFPPAIACRAAALVADTPAATLGALLLNAEAMYLCQDQSRLHRVRTLIEAADNRSIAAAYLILANAIVWTRFGWTAETDLAPLMTNRNADIRFVATSAMGRHGAHSFEPLLAALDDPDARVRAQAVTGLCFRTQMCKLNGPAYFAQPGNEGKLKILLGGGPAQASPAHLNLRPYLFAAMLVAAAAMIFALERDKRKR